MSDSSFPDRPDHVDFKLLSRLMIELDENPEYAADFPAYVASIADPESLIYMANGRAMMALDTMGQRRTLEWLAAFGAMYLDGFMLGYEFSKRKQGEQ